MDVGGLLLTGGASRRMGTDKALLAGGDGHALARRTARLLSAVACIAVEVGPGASGLPAVADDHPGAGPLAATASGAAALRGRRWTGAAIVVATDLPALDGGALRWLAAHPAPGSVVPVVAGRPQPLCARWSGDDLLLAADLVGDGRRSMMDLIRAAHPCLAAVGGAGTPAEDAFADVDTPAEAARVGIAVPTQEHR